MQILPEANILALEYLFRFKYLTNSQLYKLGISPSIRYVAIVMKRFFDTKKPLVRKLSFGVDPKMGRLESVYMLTKKGAEYLSDVLDIPFEEINYPKGNGAYYRDYFHRKATIDFHIKLYLESKKENFSIDFFHTYFDKISSQKSKNEVNRLQSLSKVVYEDGSYYIPDAIYKITKNNNQDYLYVLEVHNGNDIKRALETLDKNIKALVDGSVSRKYNYIHDFKIVMIFENERIKGNFSLVFNDIEEYISLKNYLITEVKT